MLPLADWPIEDRKNLIGVFTDIDDTLTSDGAITADALAALADLKAAGLHVIPITGRPVGWSQVFVAGDAAKGVAPWPVDCIVAENGAVAIFKKENSNRPSSNIDSLLSKLYQQEAATRARNQVRMQAVAARVLKEVPGAALSQDSAGRETDIAIDHSEFAALSQDQIDQVVRILREEGMSATVSSIHINGWFGAHNKLAGARWIVRALFDRDLDAEIGRWVYVGDSTNDQVMFEAFPHSVGVANIARFLPQLKNWPRYVTQNARGAGFAEVARAVMFRACPERPGW